MLRKLKVVYKYKFTILKTILLRNTHFLIGFRVEFNKEFYILFNLHIIYMKNLLGITCYAINHCNITFNLSFQNLCIKIYYLSLSRFFLILKMELILSRTTKVNLKLSAFKSYLSMV